MAKRKNNPLGGPGDPRHGTAHAYSYHHCRCNPCKGAHREAQAKWKETPVRVHSAGGYEKGCRCVVCCSAKSRLNSSTNRRASLRRAARVVDMGGLA